ncbi:MAG: PorT family protein [Chitinophagaceae bacterium]|nr:PorT family protein [Chitinophagaceae bacterium]
MKRMFLLLTGFCFAIGLQAQETEKSDTVKIGNITIIKKDDGKSKGSSSNDTEVKIEKKKSKGKSTNWGIVDIGINQFNDQTNYSSAAIQDPSTGFAPGANEDWFKLRNNKSINVNIWIFTQRVSLIKDVVNLKYGIGLELNNYRFSRQVKFNTDPTKVVLDNSTSYSKNKLAADYLTVPMMLNFNLTPKKKNPVGFSAGVSAGYLYSSRQKTITAADGKQKTRNDFDLRPFKLSYVGELNLGFIRLYGSLATQSMFKKGLDQTPYNIGIRLSNW